MLNVLAALNTVYPNETTGMFLSSYLRSRMKALFGIEIHVGG